MKRLVLVLAIDLIRGANSFQQWHSNHLHSGSWSIKRKVICAASINDNDEDAPENLADSLKSLIDMTAGPQAPDNNPFAKEQPSTEQLEQLVSKLKGFVVENEGPEALDDDNDDAPFLDSDAYENFRTNINPDGSLTPRGGSAMNVPRRTADDKLKNLVNQKPEIPDSYYKSKPDATVEDLFSTPRANPEGVDEDMHKKIMAEEEGFQKQSEFFQEYLGGEKEGRDAAYKMRQERQRTAEREMLLKLDAEMKELEDTLDEKPKELDLVLCTKCKCPLSPLEIETGIKEGMCQVCYGEMIAETSDMRFLNAAPIGDRPYERRRSRNSFVQRRVDSPAPETRRAKPRETSRPSASGESKAAPRSSGASKAKGSPAPNTSPDKRQPRPHQSPAPPKDDEVSQLKRQAAALQQQVARYKREAEAAGSKVRQLEAENTRLNKLVVELEGSLELDRASSSEKDTSEVQPPWMKVLDPDTGEYFYWNEETEEMRWDLEDDAESND